MPRSIHLKQNEIESRNEHMSNIFHNGIASSLHGGIIPFKVSNGGVVKGYNISSSFVTFTCGLDDPFTFTTYLPHS